jgi:hypothetical protein
VKVESEADRLPFTSSDEHFGARSRPEQRGVEIALGCNAKVRELLVLREPANHLEDRTEIRALRGPDAQTCRR